MLIDSLLRISIGTCIYKYSLLQYFILEILVKIRKSAVLKSLWTTKRTKNNIEIIGQFNHTTVIQLTYTITV